MADTLRTFLDRRERILLEQIALHRKQLEPLEKELLEIRRAKTAIALDPQSGVGMLSDAVQNYLFDRPRYQHMTMKELVHAALSQHFPQGASANQLIDFFQKSWGRTIQRENLSPQLSRLKRDGIINHKDNLWFVQRATEPVAAVSSPQEQKE